MKGISEEQIKNGFNELAKRGDSWPPSAPEFRQLCINENGDTQEQRAFNAQIENQKLKRLEAKKADPMTAEIHLKSMRNKLNVSRGES